MIVLEQKFDEARNDGLLLPSALQSAMQTADEPDTTPSVAPRTRLVKRTPSVQSARKPHTLEIFGPSKNALAPIKFEINYRHLFCV